MTHKLNFPRLSVKVLSALFVLVAAMLCATPAFATTPTILISQIMGAGGNGTNPYTSDYVELFNYGSSSVTLTGWSLQYASATSTTSSGIVYTIPTVTMPAGGYYLISGAVTANGGTTDPSDLITAAAISGYDGRVFLVDSVTALPSTSVNAPASDSTIIDMVGYGSTTEAVPNSYEGTSYAPGPTSSAISYTSYMQRTNICVNNYSNSTEWTLLLMPTPGTTPSTATNPVGASAPHNSNSTKTVCGASTPVATTTFTPASIVQGGSSLLTVAVSGAGTVTGVAANLSALGGSSAQPLYDDGTHGDATAGDGIYSFTVATTGAQATGGFAVTPSVTSGTAVVATTATLTVTTSVVATAIHTIQATPASYLNTVVNVTGIVTGVRSTGFYLETPTASQNNPLTTASEAIYVNTGTPLPAAAVVGNSVQLLGTVAYSQPAATGYLALALQLNSPSGYNILLTAQTLPTAVTLTSTNLSATGTTTQLLQYQSMRVSAPSMTTTSGTGGTLTETAETYVSNGQFYATLTGVARPFRAIGADSRDAAPTAGAPSAWTRWTAPTNLLLVDTAALGGAAVDVVTGSTVVPATGVLDYSSGQPDLMISSVTAERPVVVQGSPSTTATSSTASNLTVATLNMNRFYDTETTVTGATIITSGAYSGRLAKASNAIRNSMGFPDVIAVQEVESATELTALSAQISSDATSNSQTDPAYVGTMGTVGPNGYGVGFLTKPAKVTVSGSGTFGSGCGSYCYPNPTTGTNSAIWDTPPMYINAKALRGSIPANAYGMYIVNAEMLPTTGINSNTVSNLSTVGAGVRAKRLAQAQQLAGSVITLGTTQPIIVAADTNAYEFSDGYVDVNGILTNTQVAQNTVVSYNSNTYATGLTDLAPTLAATTRYTANESGISDTLDHIYYSASTPTGTTLQAVHIDSDYNATALNTTTTPLRTSSHDALVATVQVPALPAALTFNPNSLTFPAQIVGTSSASKPVVVTNTSTTAPITFTSIVASAGFSQTNNCTPSIAALGTCTINVTFSPTTAGSPTGTVLLTDNDTTGTQTITLSGTSYNLLTTNTTLTSAPTAPIFSQAVTLTATIPGNGTTAPTGTVTFKDGTNTLCSAVTVAGTASSVTATCAAGTALTATTHSLTAVYSGDTVYATSTGPLSLTVAPITSATSIVALPTSTTFGLPVALTAGVTSNLGTTPTGTVQFMDGTNAIGTAQTLTNGIATLSTSTLTVATHSITAVYSGTTTGTIYPTSTSTPVTVTVAPALVLDFTLTLGNSQMIVGGAIKAQSTSVTIIAVNGFSSAVSLTCSGLPAQSSCTFNPATVTPAGSGQSTLTISTAAASNAKPHFGFEKSSGFALAFTLLAAPFAFRKRKSALRLLALLVILLAGMQALTGCGSGTTPNGTATVTVTGTAATGQVHMATITLITQ